MPRKKQSFRTREEGNHSIRRRIGLLLVLLLAGPAASGHGEEAAVPVVTVVAERSAGLVRDFSLTGSVTPRRQARLSARTTGLVSEVKVDAGSAVSEGDVLMTLDIRIAEIALELIRAEIVQSGIELEEAKRKEEEVRELSKTGGIAKSEAESLKSDARVREASLRQLEIREREQIEMIERHRLIAPFDGVVSRKLTEAGEWVPTGTPVLELVEMANPRFDLQVPQEYLARISRAEKVLVRLDAYPGKPLEADIEVMVPVKDNTSRTFLTRLALNDPEKFAAPGMSGTAEISFRPSEWETVQVPRDAVVRFPDGGIKVWIVTQSDESTMVSSREVKTGGSLGTFTEILEGLEGGETVVLKGNEGLREDQKVKVQSNRAIPDLP